MVDKKQKALVISKREGAFAAVNSGIVQNFIIPFALVLQTTNFLIGILSSFVGLIGPIAQISNSRLMERYTRKKIVLVSALIQILILIPIIVLGILFYFDIFVDALPILLILFYSLYVAIGAVNAPIWFSWMGDLVPEKYRGDYFSKRNRLIGTVAIVSILIGGFFLDFFKTQGLVLFGFAILFFIAFIARFISIIMLSKQYHPNFKLKKGYYFSFYDFIKYSPKNNFGRFAIFVGAMYLAVAIASPFFTVHMLKELEYSYALFTVVNLSASVFSLMTLSFWGKFADKYGNHLVLKICSFFIPLVPLLWMLSPNPFYLILVPSLISGIFWGGFNLSVSNFIYDSTKSEHRALCNAYTYVLMGFGGFFGGLIGAVIVKFVQVDFLSNIFLFIFLISGIARYLVVFLFLPSFKEVRATKRPPLLIRELKHLGNIEYGAHHFRDSLFQNSYLFYGPVRHVRKQ